MLMSVVRLMMESFLCSDIRGVGSMLFYFSSQIPTHTAAFTSQRDDKYVQNIRL
jgi:hypothetical protein